MKIHWREDGNPNGLPVVFANSLGTDLRLWDAVIPLISNGCRLIRFDMRGHGATSCPKAPYTMLDLTNDAAALLDHLKVRNCVFVGLSIGGMVGLGLARHRPDLVRGLVLANSASRMGDPKMWQDRISALRQSGLESQVDAVMIRWFSQGFRDSGDLSPWRELLLQTPLEGYVGCCHAISKADLSDATSKLSLPLLAIAGSDDLACPSAAVASTANLVDGSKFVDIAGVGHLPCVEKPEVFATLVNEFIKEIGSV